MKVALKGIHHQFGDNKVLKNIDLEIEEGELFTLLGPSGCGKTTILRIVAGFLTPSEGQVLLGGQDITQLTPEKRNIGTVFQNYALFPHMNVEENVSYGLKLKRLPSKTLHDRVRTYLDLVGMDELRKRKIQELSGGQQQRVALARSLAIEPKVLLLDEPMSNLDAALRDKTRDEIHLLQQKLKITTLFITHDQKEAISISNRIAVMNNGKVIQSGTPREVYSTPADAFTANFVGVSNVFTLEEWSELGGKTDEPGFQEIFIRPELIRMGIVRPSTQCMPGEITKVIFNGSTVDYEVKTKGRMLRVLELNCGWDFQRKQPGCNVFLSLV